MAQEKGINEPEDPAKLIKDYGDQVIKCCINSWNQLCPQHQLTNLEEMTRRKRWLFCGHEVTSLKEEGARGEISKLMLEVNEHLTRKALRKHPDSPVIILNCWTWWNYGREQVHGWLEHIEVDIEKGCVTKFPEILAPAPHMYVYPSP